MSDNGQRRGWKVVLAKGVSAPGLRPVWLNPRVSTILLAFAWIGVLALYVAVRPA